MRYTKFVILSVCAGMCTVYAVYDTQSRIRCLEAENKELRQLVEEQHQSTLGFLAHYRQRLDAIDIRQGKPVLGTDAIRNAKHQILMEDMGKQ